ncbi:MAG TPA: NUDIX hydrolase, partial [Thermodesulfobacteriota bacterium]|nr:NUDIX hydrolase [Thermodesulfobacteriota bacterium]
RAAGRSRVRTAAQVSAGGVIYRPAGAGQVEVALIGVTGREGRRVWALPKGLVEPSETLAETARREVLEETGLAGEVEAPLGTVTYWYTSREEGIRYHKRVHYFLLRFQEGSPEGHDREVEEVRWVPIEEAVRMATYDNERAVLERARERLRGAGAGEAAGPGRS